LTGRLRRIPAPLALLLAVATLQTLAWIVVLPAFQGPDEDSHLAYVQRIVDKHKIPWRPGGGPANFSGFSPEMERAESLTGLGPLIGNIAARPLWTSPDVALWRRADAAGGPRYRDSKGLYTASYKNPPVYYLYAAVPYAVADGGSIFDRLELVRVFDIPLLLAALVFVWLVIGQLAGRGWPQVVGTGAAALLPQLTNVTAGISPDILVIAEWGAAIYLMLLILRDGPRRWLVAALAALCVLAVATHARNLMLPVPAILAVVFALGRERGWRRSTPIKATAFVWLVYLAVVLVVAPLGKGNLRQFVSYVWQFYLPRLGFMTPTIGPPHYGFRQAYVDRLYGSLSWLEVVLPRGVEHALWLASLAALVVLVVVLVRRWAAVRARAPEAIVLASAVLALLLGLHLAAYRAMVANPSDPILTARYVLPLLPLFGTAIALIVGAFPRRAGGALAGVLLATGVALQLMSIGLLVERFYA
jgi:dolichyl-phosphate-mannose-protein mannosyltransferase